MKGKTKQIKFINKQNLGSQFDLVRIEELFVREDLDHSIEEHHLVDFYILLIIEKGKGNHTIDFTDYSLSKGTVLTIRKDQIHKFFKNKQIRGSLLMFTNQFLVSYLEKMESQKTILLFNEQLGKPKIELDKTNYKSISQILERIKQEYFDVNDDFSLGIIRSELHILITQLFRLKSVNEQVKFEKKYLKEFIEFQSLVENNITKTTKIKEFAQKMCVSTKTLNNITQSIVHKSAKEFVDEIRTKQIKRLLINTKLTVKEIAYITGFEETTNFYKYFKRQTNSTPEQFRGTS